MVRRVGKKANPPYGREAGITRTASSSVLPDGAAFTDGSERLLSSLDRTPGSQGFGLKAP
jgi:hypothetical protein